MRELPILFSGDMVRSIFAGRKTATRRQHEILGYHPGDRMYVREEFSGPARMKPKIDPPKTWPPGTPIWYWADGNPEVGDWTKPKPGMHLPKQFSRIILECTGSRFQTLHDISEEEAIAEGVEPEPYRGSDPEYAGQVAWRDYTVLPDGTRHPWAVAGMRTAVLSFETLWRTINGNESWERNPRVAVYEFKDITLESAS